MNLKFDTEQFDKYQAILASEIAERVMIKLKEAGMEGQQLEEYTASITFSIANVIDDMAAIEADGMEVRPYLTFRTGDDEILHCGENSCTNTFVYDVLKKIFS
jgi:hypothetical protein